MFDLERNIELSGHWQTVSRRGGITVPVSNYKIIRSDLFYRHIFYIYLRCNIELIYLMQREAYPSGFFVVLVVKGEDTDCNGISGSNPLRTKNVTLIISPTITKRDYIIASGSAGAIALCFCIFYITAVVVFNIKKSREYAKQEPINEENQDIADHVPSPSMTGEVIKISKRLEV